MGLNSFLLVQVVSPARELPHVMGMVKRKKEGREGKKEEMERKKKKKKLLTFQQKSELYHSIRGWLPIQGLHLPDSLVLSKAIWLVLTDVQEATCTRLRSKLPSPYFLLHQHWLERTRGPRRWQRCEMKGIWISIWSNAFFQLQISAWLILFFDCGVSTIIYLLWSFQ